MNYTELDRIIQQRPSAIQNSIAMKILQVVSMVLSVGFVFFAIATISQTTNITSLLDSMLGSEDIFVYKSDGEQVNYLLQAISAICFVLAVIFFFVAMLSKMVLKRNGFIFDIVAWYDDMIKAYADASEQSKNS